MEAGGDPVSPAHDFCVVTDVVTLCNQCGRPETPEIRSEACFARQDDNDTIARKLTWSIILASYGQREAGR